MTLWYFLYNTLLKTAAVLLSPFLLYKIISRKKHREGLLQKIGFYKKSKEGKSIWFHAVSVGEVIAAVPLVKRTMSQYPGYRLVISTVTPTGNRVAKKMLPEVDDILYFPFDFSFSVKRAIDAIDPAMCLILETELWPNYIRELYLRNIPVVIINGRISSRSFKRYMFFSRLMKGLFRQVTLLGMQSDTDAKRVISLGASPEKVSVSGNIKYDREIHSFSEKELLSIKESVGFLPETPILLAGSTHPGEEVIIVTVYKKLLDTHPELALLVAPRHPEKIGVVAKAVTDAGFIPLYRTKLNGKKVSPSRKEVLLLDTIGELASLYAVSEIVFIGGSMIPHGGQNILEPASCKKPVLFGKYMDNFREISRNMTKAGAAICVQDEEELYNQIDGLLKNPKNMKAMGQKGFDLVYKNRGAVEKCLRLVGKGLQVGDQ